MNEKNKRTRGILIASIVFALLLITAVAIYAMRPTEMIRQEDNLEAIPKVSQLKLTEGDSGMIKEEQQYVEHQVLAVANSKREAKKIAKTIGGELLSFENQIATIQIGVTVEEMMQMLDGDPSLPKVYPNYQNYSN